MRLEGGADDVVLRLLRGERGTGGLGVEAEHPGARDSSRRSWSRMMPAQRRRAARNLATSSRKLLCALKKKERRGAKRSMSRPASMAAWT